MSDSGKEWPSQLSDAEYEARFGCKRTPVGNDDLVLDEMVRDFTTLGKCSKSEVRRRIKEYVSAQRDKEIEDLREKVRYAQHYFDSPASFSHEEFAGVAEKVYGPGITYTGKVPYLDEMCDAREEIKRIKMDRLGITEQDIAESMPPKPWENGR